MPVALYSGPWGFGECERPQWCWGRWFFTANSDRAPLPSSEICTSKLVEIAISYAGTVPIAEHSIYQRTCSATLSSPLVLDNPSPLLCTNACIDQNYPYSFHNNLCFSARNEPTHISRSVSFSDLDNLTLIRIQNQHLPFPNRDTKKSGYYCSKRWYPRWRWYLPMLLFALIGQSKI